jgi:hypothetical protein
MMTSWPDLWLDESMQVVVSTLLLTDDVIQLNNILVTKDIIRNNSNKVNIFLRNENW